MPFVSFSCLISKLYITVLNKSASSSICSCGSITLSRFPAMIDKFCCTKKNTTMSAPRPQSGNYCH